MSEPPRRIFLLDGHSLAYRAFFALPQTLATSSGTVTNAVYGFTSMLIKLLGDEHPDLLAVAFDMGAPTVRLEMDADYKAGRAETPADFRPQLGLIEEGSAKAATCTKVDAGKLPVKHSRRARQTCSRWLMSVTKMCSSGGGPTLPRKTTCRWISLRRSKNDRIGLPTNQIANHAKTPPTTVAAIGPAGDG